MSVYFILQKLREIDWTISIPVIMDEFREWILKLFWSAFKSQLHLGIATIVLLKRKIKRRVTKTDGVFSSSIFPIKLSKLFLLHNLVNCIWFKYCWETLNHLKRNFSTLDSNQTISSFLENWKFFLKIIQQLV